MSEGGATQAILSGPAGAASIVVVPPLGMPSGLMLPFARVLANHLRVVLVELPGAGRAAEAGPTTTRTLASVLAGVMRASCSGPAHLFGVSFGGMVAMWLAIDAPALVDHLVLASTAARGRDAILADPSEKLALLARAIGRGPTRVALAEAVASEQTRDDPQQARRIADQIAASPRDDAELLWLAAAVAAHDASGALGGIRAPTLVLTGADDELVPPPLQDALASAIRGAGHQTIAGAGHAITLDQPEATGRAVLAFVRAHSAEDGVRRTVAVRR